MMLRRDSLMISGLCAVAGMLLLVSGSVAADEGQAAHETDGLSSLTAEEVAARNAAARGGLEAWHAVRALSETGHLKLAGMRPTRPRHAGPDLPRRSGPMPSLEPVQFTMHLKRPNRLRLEASYQGASAVEIFDGKEGWTVTQSTHGPVATRLSADDARATAAQEQIEGPLMNYKANGAQLSMDGVEDLDGRRTYRLTLKSRDGESRHVWVDADTFLDTKIDGTRRFNGKLWPVETTFSDYKQVQGLQIPHVLSTSIVGVNLAERIVIDRVAVNPVLDETIFAPSGAPGPP